jgi:hypothetical protein
LLLLLDLVTFLSFVSSAARPKQVEGDWHVRGPCRRPSGSVRPMGGRSDGVAQMSCAAPGRPGTTACLGCLVSRHAVRNPCRRGAAAAATACFALPRLCARHPVDPGRRLVRVAGVQRSDGILDPCRMPNGPTRERDRGAVKLVSRHAVRDPCRRGAAAALGFALPRLCARRPVDPGRRLVWVATRTDQISDGSTRPLP